jgi:hypothetical protein
MLSFAMKLHLFTFVSGIISMFTFIFPPSLNQTFFSEYSPQNIDTMAHVAAKLPGQRLPYCDTRQFKVTRQDVRDHCSLALGQLVKEDYERWGPIKWLIEEP